MDEEEKFLERVVAGKEFISKYNQGEIGIRVVAALGLVAFDLVTDLTVVARDAVKEYQRRGFTQRTSRQPIDGIPE